jgi:cytochrome c
MIRRIAKLALVLATATALMSGAALASSDGDAAKGKKVFNKCKACHSLKAGKNKIGPSLNGIIGRPAATAKGFKYSKAMKASGLTWDEETLKKFLTKPKKFVPGTKMAFAGLKKEKQRDNVIAYLREKAM